MLLTGIIYGMLTGQADAVSGAVLDSAKEAVTLCVTMLGVLALWMGLMEIAKDAGLIRAASRKIQPLIRFLFPGIPAGHPAGEQITLNFIANILGLGWAATPAGLKAMEELAKLEGERREKDVTGAQGLRQSGVTSGSGLAEGQEAGQRGVEREVADAPESGQVKTVSARVHCAQSIETEAGSAAEQRVWKRPGSGAEQSMQKRKRLGGIKAMPRGVASNEMCTFLILNISSLQLIPVNVIAYRSQYGSVNPTAIVGPGLLATAVSTGVAIVFCKLMDKRKRRA